MSSWTEGYYYTTPPLSTVLRFHHLFHFLDATYALTVGVINPVPRPPPFFRFMCILHTGIQ